MSCWPGRRSTLSATLRAALAQESESEQEIDETVQAVQLQPDPLKHNHKYVLIRHLSQGSAGFVVHARNRDTQDQVLAAVHAV